MTSPFTCPCTEKKGMPTHQVPSASPVTIFFFPMLILASCYIVPAHLYLNSLMIFWNSKVDCEAVPTLTHFSCWSRPYFITQIHRDRQTANLTAKSWHKYLMFSSLLYLMFLNVPDVGGRDTTAVLYLALFTHPIVLILSCKTLQSEFTEDG